MSVRTLLRPRQLLIFDFLNAIAEKVTIDVGHPSVSLRLATPSRADPDLCGWN